MGQTPLGLHHQGSQGVGRFTGLGHPNREGVGGQRRRRIAELTGVVHRCGHPGELLQQEGPHHRCMAAGAAGQDLNPLNPGVEGIVHRQRHRLLRRQSLGQVARHPQLCGLRLLMDLLEHEVAELALVGHVVHTAELGGHALLARPCRVVELNTEG